MNVKFFLAIAGALLVVTLAFPPMVLEYSVFDLDTGKEAKLIDTWWVPIWQTAGTPIGTQATYLLAEWVGILLISFGLAIIAQRRKPKDIGSSLIIGAFLLGLLLFNAPHENQRVDFKPLGLGYRSTPKVESHISFEPVWVAETKMLTHYVLLGVSGIIVGTAALTILGLFRKPTQTSVETEETVS